MINLVSLHPGPLPQHASISSLGFPVFSSLYPNFLCLNMSGVKTHVRQETNINHLGLVAWLWASSDEMADVPLSLRYLANHHNHIPYLKDEMADVHLSLRYLANRTLGLLLGCGLLLTRWPMCL